jgi:DNA-directed RNA polymerase I, II, and III subunit RPABC1
MPEVPQKNPTNTNHPSITLRNRNFFLAPMQSEETNYRLWRVRKTVFQMLHDRGYHVAEKYLEETRDQFEQYWRDILGRGGNRNELVILVTKKSDPNDQIIVFFPDENKPVGVKPIRVLTEKMEERKLSHAILVVQQKLTAFARTAIQEMGPKFEIEVFHESELVVNVTKHVLVPEHVPLTADEKKSLLERYKVKENQLPRIQQSDPVARYFGLKKGQVVKIIRPSETAGRYVTYRLCF